jgi:calcium release-activated calcium channel protein 1
MAALGFSAFTEYRESDRWNEAQGWRQYDVQHMEAEKEWRSVDVEWMEQQRRRLVLEHDWREMDMHQRWLDNLRREVDEKVQQLATLSNLSALLAGFAIVALVGPCSRQLRFRPCAPNRLIFCVCARCCGSLCRWN